MNHSMKRLSWITVRPPSGLSYHFLIDVAVRVSPADVCCGMVSCRQLSLDMS